MSDGRDLLDRAVRAAELARDQMAAKVPELDVIDPRSLVGRPGVAAAEPTHLYIETHSVGLTGFQADDWLRDERAVDIELADRRRIIPLFTFALGEQDVDRLVSALRDMVDEHPDVGGEADIALLPSRRDLRTEQTVLSRDAFFAKTERVKSTDPIVDYLEEIVAAGAFLEGAADQALDELRVVAEKREHLRFAPTCSGRGAGRQTERSDGWRGQSWRK